MVTSDQKSRNVEAFEKLVKVAALGEAPVAPLTDWYSLAPTEPMGGYWYFGFDCPACSRFSPMFLDFSDGHLGNPFSNYGVQAVCYFCKVNVRRPSECIRSAQWPREPGLAPVKTEYANRVARRYKDDPEYRPLSGPLHHYTSVDALLSILRTRSLWATNVRCLNDSSESELGLALMREVAEEARRTATGIDSECVPYSGGAGGCAIANPETSILSLSGERATLPAAALNPLTRRGVAEDTRSIVLDEYALVHIGPQAASFKQVSEDFQVTPSLVNTLTSQSSSGVVPVAVPLEAAEWQLVDIEGSSRSDRKHLRGGSGAMLVIQHQREHPANESFAPMPHITFTPQVFASSPPAQERRGFAIVDFGESGRILNVHAISESAAPAGSAIAAAISNAVSTQFSDERRHDHRVYLAYEIDGRVLRVAGSPFATMPMCCGPCYGPCNL